MADVIAQLPPNTIDIVEATIDRWTPLYPIVHKSSTIVAIQGLLSSYQSRGFDLVILYQIVQVRPSGDGTEETGMVVSIFFRFSSAYHEMPRLIRDQDVDTDFPTSIGHDLLSRTHVEFPLPGERSRVDTAISPFKFARIICCTLEDFYTTTRRRGGVAKIVRLQTELNMWERAVLEPEIDPEPPTPVTSKSLEVTFLRVAHCVATIHIHQLALSFTTADPQFVSGFR
ncbi:transcriptional activator acu-15 [Fusarium phyllophilum]|uniref:Transcriptional activator acu-15 n=1 Tax=Fusarium phyllophilum TaxID=47803 RepID=A0A8H5ICX4_9HYPO|nr:transcriptional activator acu-15 [Fusarium phyllophilum]